VERQEVDWRRSSDVGASWNIDCDALSLWRCCRRRVVGGGDRKNSIGLLRVALENSELRGVGAWGWLRNRQDGDCCWLRRSGFIVATECG